MEPNQALRLLNEIVAQVPLTRQVHQQVLEALGTLERAIGENGSTGEAKPTRAKRKTKSTQESAE